MLVMNAPKGCVSECVYDELATIPGVVKVIPRPDRLYMKVSGKVLGDRYPELIGADNIPVVFDALESALKVDRSRVLQETRVSFLHLTRDFRVNDPGAVLQSFRAVPVPQKYYLQGWSATSLSFTNQAKSPRYRDRLTVYDKAAEIRRKPVPGVDPEAFENAIRIEYRVSGSETIRRKLDISDNRLSMVLNASGGMHATLLSFFGEPPPERCEPTTAKELWDQLAVAELKNRFDEDPERALVFLSSVMRDSRRYKARVRDLW